MDELVKRLDALVAHYGQPTIDATLAAARTEAHSKLWKAAYEGGLGLVVLLVSGAYLPKFLALVSRDIDGQAFLGLLMTSAVGVIALIPVLTSIWTVIDPWTWTQLRHPDVWVAKKVILDKRSTSRGEI